MRGAGLNIRPALALALALALVFAGAARPAAGAGPRKVTRPVPAPGVVQEWLTSGDRAHLLERQPDLALVPFERPLRPGMAAPPVRAPLVEVDASQVFQEMAGFGAAITDASAFLIHHLAAAQRDALLRDLFGPEPGIGFAMTRISIGASDFSLRHYSLDDVPPGQRDPALEHFSIEPMREDVIPVLRSASGVNPKLKVIASPWSAPAWMKTGTRVGAGTLKPDSYEPFARYLVRTAEALRQEGVQLFALTVQNEPHFEPEDYPGMRFGPRARASFVGDHLGPLLHEKAPGVQIFEWDHNWDEPSSPLRVLEDPSAEPYVDAVAWHCYKGDVSAQTRVHDRYPDKDVYMTECAGGEWRPKWDDAFASTTRSLVVGATRNWASGVVMWNLALDENHGPHTGGCTDCRGVVTIHSRTGEVTRNPEYYALGHASRFVRPGAHRVASTEDAGSVQTVAFLNDEEGSLVLVAVNPSPKDQAFTVRWEGRAFDANLPPASVATYRWRAGK